MRRSVLAFIVVAAAAVGAGLYTAYATDREYGRLVAAGDEALAMDQPFLALEAYSGAITLRPESMLAHLKRGMTYKQQGELESAARDLRRAIALDATATMPLELLGDTYLAMARHDRASERYQAYLALDDRAASIWYKLGLAHYRSGDAQRAIQPLQRALSLQESMPEARLLLGLCLRDRGDLAGAREALEAATRLAPGLTAPREALAGVYAESGDHSRAVDQLEALAALDPTAPGRFVALGLAHARARRHEAAVLTLSRAVERFPNDSSVYAALGRVWLDAAEARDDRVSLNKALEALGTAASHSDVTSEALTDLGRAWLMAGDTAAAARALRQATARLPVAPDAYWHLARVASQASRIQEARDALIRWVALVGDSTQLGTAATQIAAYSVRLGQPQLALLWIDRAIGEAGETPALVRLRERATAAAASPR